MQDQRMLKAEEAPVPKPQKKKLPTQKAPKVQTQGNGVKRVQELIMPGQKASKRSSSEMRSFLQPEKSTSDSLRGLSSSGNEYRALSRKYLLLEEESCGLGRELTEVEADIVSLENEKFALLDELVILEGLIDPSEFQSHGHRVP